MAGSTFGTLFRVTTFGESHGAALGAVIDGCPAGLQLVEEDIQAYLDRRKPGQSQFTTARKEGDRCRILSGVFEGRTEGTPIAVVVENTDQRSKDYSAIQNLYRPGHADFGYDMKYGFRDYRGGGRSSGRETIGRVIGGAVAAKVLSEFKIRAEAWTESVGPFAVPEEKLAPETLDIRECRKNPLWMPDQETAAKAESYLCEVKNGLDSCGGIVGCRICGVPAGLGEPVFDKLDALLSQAVMSLGAVKGIEFGSGFKAALLRGSEDNDSFCAAAGDSGARLRCPLPIEKTSNHAGGVLGGLSDGSEIRFRAAVKATPSIARKQRTVDRNGRDTEIEIRGRHDPVIMPRAAVVIECMADLVILDLLLRNTAARMEFLRKIYG